MSLKMSVVEREAFLADVHVGVISIEQPGKPPLSAPIWYDYDPRIGVWIITEQDSIKGRLLKDAGRFTLVAQVEAPPAYRYVSVEGSVSSVRESDKEKDSRPMAHRYFGKELGDLYTDAPGKGKNLVFTMQPERWRTVDYGKLAG
jgi:nitroimidazol reductase NimA-like FMN-containing flavoprotein (pyridoxamine 5'-phosphate oxidase superfamily)